jgi:phospholipid/cholesterol/gamma-HCH transport system substrate-binding protein
VRRHAIETVMGAVVLLVAALFVYFAWITAEVRTAPGYEVSARFFKIGGLAGGSDVRISGIKVGSVTGTRLDPETFDAVVILSIDHGVKLPEDTVAAIDSEGLLGNQYVRLEPGKAAGVLAAGGAIAQTKAYRSLEDQVGEIIFLATSPAKPAGQ